jgi:hypothetical protein
MPAQFPRPPTLGPEAMAELELWADVDADADASPFNRAGTARNVIRNAEAWGPCLVALLSARGNLKPGANPLEALEDLIDRAEAAP